MTNQSDRSPHARPLIALAVGAALLGAACTSPAEPGPAAGTPAATVAASTATVAATATQTAATAAITVKGAWARSMPGNPNENSASYAQVANSGAQADRLVAASVPSSIAATVELHRTVRVGDQMKMEPVPGFDIAPGATLTLEPGGNHIMLLNLAAPLKAGTKVPVSLRFERGPAMTVEFEVRDATAMPAPMPMGSATAMPGGMR